MNLVDTPVCDLCLHGVEGDLQHTFLECDFNNVVNDWVIGVLIDIDPSLIDIELSSQSIITLDSSIEVTSRLPVLFFLSLVFDYIWRRRQSIKSISLTELHAMISVDVYILKSTKFMKAAQTIENALNFDVYL